MSMEGAGEMGHGHSNSGHHTECLLWVRRCIKETTDVLSFDLLNSSGR